MNPEFDYSKLNEKIIRTFLTRTAFCEAFGVSTSNLSLKMNNKHYFTQPQIAKACSLLKIPQSQVGKYFLPQKLRNLNKKERC